MTIEEFIKIRFRCHSNPKYVNKVDVAEYFGKELASKKIRFMPIYSTNLFPELVKINREIYLIWDNHFWNIFEYFLSLFKLGVVACSPAHKKWGIKQACALNSLVLANITDKIPQLSLMFCNLYIESGANCGLYSTRFFYPKGENFLDLLLAQIYVLAHELVHNEFRLKPSLLEQSLNGIFSNAVSFIKKNHVNPTTDYEKGLDSILKEVYNIGKEKNERLTEELLCDIVAARTTIEFAMQIISKIGNVDFFINQVMNLIIQTSYFSAWIRQLDEHWNRIYKVWRSVPHTPKCFCQSYYNCDRPISHIDASVRLGCLCLVCQYFFEKNFGYDKEFNIQKTDIFDIASVKMISPRFAFEMLYKGDFFVNKLPASDARSIRDITLGWL